MGKVRTNNHESEQIPKKSCLQLKKPNMARKGNMTDVLR
jgi:hypothetical protein